MEKFNYFKGERIVKKYKKPNLMNDNIISKTKALAPIAAVAGLSVGGAALLGAALGLSTGKDFRPKNLQMSLKPTVKA